MSFLMDLNDTYSHIRGQILLMDPLPPLNKVFSLLTQEERQMLRRLLLNMRNLLVSNQTKVLRLI